MAWPSPPSNGVNVVIPRPFFSLEISRWDNRAVPCRISTSSINHETGSMVEKYDIVEQLQKATSVNLEPPVASRCG